MISTNDRQLQLKIVGFSAGVSAAIAALVSLDYALKTGVLMGLTAAFGRMQPASALGILVMSMVLLGQTFTTERKWKSVLGTSACVLLFAFAAFSLDLAAKNRVAPMAPLTALNFFILSVSWIFGRALPISWPRTSQVLAVFSLLASFQGLVSYLLGLTNLNDALTIPMSFLSGVCFVLLSTAMIVVQAQAGFGRVLIAQTPSAAITRKMLIGVLLVPIFMKTLTNLGVMHGIYTQDFKSLLEVMGSIALMATIVVSAGLVLFDSETARRDLVGREFEALLRARKSLEAETRARQQLKIVTDSIPAMIAQFDLNERYCFVNQAHEEWLHRPLHEFYGMTFHDVAGDEAYSSLRPYIERVLKGETVHTEGRFERPMGPMDYSVVFVPDRDLRGTIRGFITLVTDISEQKRTSQALEEAKSRAEEASQAKTNFLANMSHELRTPLGAVLGFSELLAGSEPLTEQERGDFSAAVRRNGDHLLHLIDDILDISRVETGNLTIHKKYFILSEMIKDLSAAARLQANEKELDFRVRYLTAVPDQIHSDPVRLRQCLMNLLGNAIKFTQKGRVLLEIEMQDTKLVFRVEDTGMGIVPEAANQLFKPFMQGDVSFTRRFGGTGLGLALSRRIASALGGSLSLTKSTVGKGSVFTLEIDPDLPQMAGQVGVAFPHSEVATEKLTANAEARAACGYPMARLHGTRVLLVEDSKDNQALIKTFLGSAGAQVEVAGDGQEGVEMALQDDFDIVLMDIQMPNMDGYDAIKRLRSFGYRVPVVALTAHAMKGDRDKCLRLGFADHLSKPVNRNQLFLAIEKLRAPQVAS